MKDIQALIRRRRGQMLVHSCIYYHLNDNIISDDLWQRWANELRDLQRDNPDDIRIGYYDEHFRDWTGDSGAFLPIMERSVISLSISLLAYHEQEQLKQGVGAHASITNPI